MEIEELYSLLLRRQDVTHCEIEYYEPCTIEVSYDLIIFTAFNPIPEYINIEIASTPKGFHGTYELLILLPQECADMPKEALRAADKASKEDRIVGIKAFFKESFLVAKATVVDDSVFYNFLHKKSALEVLYEAAEQYAKNFVKYFYEEQMHTLL